ncbi:MAG: hypothetical protein E7Z92_03245 [Cyanobacteria bacterium SIG31]|nr:hypothetical protein [Cyanobacteria bacterium SIG31]
MQISSIQQTSIVRPCFNSTKNNNSPRTSNPNQKVKLLRDCAILTTMFAATTGFYYLDGDDRAKRIKSPKPFIFFSLLTLAILACKSIFQSKLS